MAEVLARARQLERGGEPAGWDGALRYGDLVLDHATRRARRGERTIELTPAEYRLLRCLFVNAERVLSDSGRRTLTQPRAALGAPTRRASSYSSNRAS